MLNQPTELREATALDALADHNRLQQDRISALTKRVNEIADRLLGSNVETETSSGSSPSTQTTGGLIGELQVGSDMLDDVIGRAHRAVDRLQKV